MIAALKLLTLGLLLVGARGCDDGSKQIELKMYDDDADGFRKAFISIASYTTGDIATNCGANCEAFTGVIESNAGATTATSATEGFCLPANACYKVVWDNTEMFDAFKPDQVNSGFTFTDVENDIVVYSQGMLASNTAVDTTAAPRSGVWCAGGTASAASACTKGEQPFTASETDELALADITVTGLCSTCKQGLFSVDGLVCVGCGKGKYGPSLGASSEEDCEECPGGGFSEVGTANLEECRNPEMNIFVANSNSHRVTAYNSNGGRHEIIHDKLENAESEHEMSGPNGLAFIDTYNFLVAEVNGIHQYNVDGEWVQMFAGYNDMSMSNQWWPSSITVLKSMNKVVVIDGNGNGPNGGNAIFFFDIADCDVGGERAKCDPSSAGVSHIPFGFTTRGGEFSALSAEGQNTLFGGGASGYMVVFPVMVSPGRTDNEIFITCEPESYGDFGATVWSFCVPGNSMCAGNIDKGAPDQYNPKIIYMHGTGNNGYGDPEGGDISGVWPIDGGSKFVVSFKAMTSFFLVCTYVNTNSNVPYSIWQNNVDYSMTQPTCVQSDFVFDPNSLIADEHREMLYVGDFSNAVVEVFDFAGKQLKSSLGKPNLLVSPSGMAFRPGVSAGFSNIVKGWGTETATAGVTKIELEMNLKDSSDNDISVVGDRDASYFSIYATSLDDSYDPPAEVTVYGTVTDELDASKLKADINLDKARTWSINVMEGNLIKQHLSGSPLKLEVVPGPTSTLSTEAVVPTGMTMGGNFTVSLVPTDKFSNPTNNEFDLFYYMWKCVGGKCSGDEDGSDNRIMIDDNRVGNKPMTFNTAQEAEGNWQVSVQMKAGMGYKDIKGSPYPVQVFNLGICGVDDTKYSAGDCTSDSEKIIKFAWKQVNVTEIGPDGKPMPLCLVEDYSLPEDIGIECEYVVASSGPAIAILLLTVIGAGVCSLMLFASLALKKKPIMKMSQPMFIYWSLTGTILLCLTNLSNLGENTKALCNVRLWAYNLTFTLVFAPLFVKTERVYKIMANTQMKRTKVGMARTFMQLGGFVVIDLIILTAWLFVDPLDSIEFPNAQYPDVSSVECAMKESSSGVFGIVMVLYKAALVASGCNMSYKTKDFDPALAESKSIMIAMYQIALLGIIALGIMAMGVNANARAFIQCAASVVGSMGVVLLIMVPKIMRRNQDSNQLMAAASKTANSTGGGTVGTLSTQSGATQVGPDQSAAKDLKISILQEKVNNLEKQLAAKS